MYEIKEPLENRKGILYIEGANALELAKEFDTPLYVYSEKRIRDNVKRVKAAFNRYYPNFKMYYAVKANNNLAILKIIKQEADGFDAAAPEEIHLALEAGAKPDEILYSGVYHRNEELAYALKAGVKINLEGISQVKRLLKFGVPEFISFRINPGISGGSIKGLVFAGEDAKFGIIENNALEAYRIAKEAGVKRFGMHMMTGSCVTDPNYFEEASSKLLDIAGNIRKELGIEFEIIDIGGGLGVSYEPGEHDLDVEAAAKKVAEVFGKKVKELDLGNPTLMMEPGRFIVCDSSVLLTRVHSIKEAYKHFIGVDAGMNTLLRPMLYDAYHQIVVANKLNEKPTEKVNIVGPVCENTDQLAKDRLMPAIEEGDLLAVLNAGAYGFSMSSHYNTRPRAAEVLVNDGKAEVIRERETIYDIYKNVIVPKRLK
ncbi:diaminopimelate decarboxylase [Candidatus Woesearchaeota archaeon]|nr:diaminopimelate decarboxylase [Candidatus Woesearchaeota archaeon]